jgi:fatty-acyl-CoA synthase
MRWPPGHAPGPHQGSADDLALLPYTSGTTGLPKGCMHTHRTLMPNVVGGGLWGHASAESVSLGVVPMFHITGLMYGVLGSVWLGSTVVLLPRWDRELAGRLIAATGVTHWTCIPTMIIDLFGSPNYRGFDLSSLRYLSGGGAAMPHAVAERLQRRVRPHLRRGLRPDRDGRAQPCQPARARQAAMPGHPDLRRRQPHRRPRHAAGIAAGRDGRDRDPRPHGLQGLLAAPRSDGGGLRRDRRQALLPHRRPGPHGRGGLFLHHRPPQAHDQRQRLQGLAQRGGAAAVQVPAGAGSLRDRHPRRLPRRDVKAVVVLRAEARGQACEQDIVDWAREHMAAYKVPREVEFVDALPRSGSGKVMWRQLQERENASRPSKR